jgi:hypothetical protein
MEKKFEIGQEVTLNVRQETYCDIFLAGDKYKIMSVKVQYLIKDEDSYGGVWVDEDELEA